MLGSRRSNSACWCTWYDKLRFSQLRITPRDTWEQVPMIQSPSSTHRVRQYLHSTRVRTQRGYQATCFAAAIAAAWLATGCVQATAEVPDLDVTRENLEFPAVPAATPAGTQVTVAQQFTYDKAPMSLPGSITSEMRATEVTIKLRSGPADLSFVHAAKLTTTIGTATKTLVEYTNSDQQRLGTEVTLPVQATNATANPWTADGSVYELSLTGELPRQDWYVDVSIRYTGTLSYSP